MESELPKKRKNNIDFRPVTEGLGFHPFSNGLPYAPIGKNNSSSGMGATAAGPPLISKAALNAHRVSVPIVPQPQLTPKTAPAATTAIPKVQVPIAPQAQNQNSAPTAQFMGVKEHYGVTYLIKRIIAYCIDTLFNLSVCIGALGTVLWKQDMNMDLLFNPGVFMLASLFLIFFNWALITAQEVIFGTSLGKRIFSLQLRGSTSALFLRAFFFLPSFGFCGLGLLWALFDSQRRCWHDVAVDVQPHEIAKL